MAFILQAFMIVVLAVVVPVLSGALFTYFMKDDKNSIILSLVSGFVMMFAVFQLFAVPAVVAGWSFQTLLMYWLVVMLALCGLSAWLNSHRFGAMWKQLKSDIKELPWIAILVIVLVLAQAFVLSYFVHIDDDDSFYVGTATTTIETDSLFRYDAYIGEPYARLPMRYALSPFPMFCALWSCLAGINVTILMHTVLPVLLIPLAYCVYYLLAKRLFPKNRTAICIFMLIACVVNIFGNVSVYTQSTFLLVRIWQGKAVLANILLPMILLMALRVFQGEKTQADWVLLLTTMLAACMVSSMGIFLAPMMLGVLALVFAIVKKSWKIFRNSLVCCAPCIIYGMMYLLMK